MIWKLPLIEKIVVVDTSPLIYLSSLGDILILKELFGKILIPEAVRKEVMSGGKGSFGFKEINEEKWIKAKKIKNILAKDHLLTDLDEGESEVIVLAEEAKANLIIMDDRLGRKLAKLQGYDTIGTIRLLMIAKDKGLISEVRSRVERIKAVGFWISDDVFNFILRQCGEL